MNVRKRTWEIVEAAGPGDTASRVFDIVILTLILLNVIAVILGSIPEVGARFKTSLYAFEMVSVFVFTIEYLARAWSCICDPRYSVVRTGRLRHALRGMSILDLLAILPFYLPFLGVDFRFLRVFRLFRIAKIVRYSSSLKLIGNVFTAKKEEMVFTTGLMLLLLIVSSSLLYFCENAVQSEVFSSIPKTMWWAVETLTTVGYGDMCPVTIAGRFCAGIIAILGIGMFALPTGILGAGFVEEIGKTKDTERICPYCGKVIG